MLSLFGSTDEHISLVTIPIGAIVIRGMRIACWMHFFPRSKVEINNEKFCLKELKNDFEIIAEHQGDSRVFLSSIGVSRITPFVHIQIMLIVK